MTVAQVKGENGSGTARNGAARTGAQALSLLAVPINAAVLQALTDRTKSLHDLRREVDFPPQTTMRTYLRELARLGVIEKHRRNAFPGDVEYGLGEAGHELLAVAEILAAWLASFPETPTRFGSGSAKSAIKALLDGWSTSMVRALAGRPLSLTELDSVIDSVSYPSLERRLGAMRLGGLVEPLSSEGRGTPYAVSEWLRRGIAPIAAAARWEGRRLGHEAPPVTVLDAEAAFLLALPLLRLPTAASGSCRLAVQVGGGARLGLAGVVASVEGGRVTTCEARIENPADSWALGTIAEWFAAVLEGDTDALTVGGDVALAEGIAGALHDTLFRPVRVRQL